jgi:selenocysteine lyase/cysteine desulfurase
MDINKYNIKNTPLADYFMKFRKSIAGIDQEFTTPFGKKKIVYADWTASGRLYKPIEERICDQIGPFVGNTHTETSVTGTLMTQAYHEAQQIIKKHVNANEDDAIISQASGMTGLVNKFQRILGLKVCDKLKNYLDIPKAYRPVVFITHMEHHSNHTSWLETIAQVEVINPDKNGLPDANHLEELLKKYKDRENKYISVTGGSNVTGIRPDVHKMAKVAHQNGAYIFVDYACAAPYVDINMHPEDEEEKLDAVIFSPHKFLGGPGSSGVLIFCRALYKNKVPDQPGGGTVKWTNAWGEQSYFDEIEAREDGGTPAFLQTIKTAMSIRLKEEMGVKNILEREEEMIHNIFPKLEEIDGLHILAGNIKDRLGIFSFFMEGLHYNLGVKLLNDRFGIQVRGGCSCAGTYGHYLLNVDRQFSKTITDLIDRGDLSTKPGWIRMSIHPTMTCNEVAYVVDAIKELADNHQEWAKDYKYNPHTNEFEYIRGDYFEENKVKGWLYDEL